MKTFVLTDAHISLLRAANVSWNGCEYGAPTIAPKRPYGNSNVIGDIARILDERDTRDPETGEWPDKTYAQFYRLHEETAVALQIVLATGSFEPGTYHADDNSRNWRKAQS